MTFKVGDEVIFSDYCLNPDFHGVKAIITYISQEYITVKCEKKFRGGIYSESFSENGLNYIRHLSPLEKALL